VSQRERLPTFYVAGYGADFFVGEMTQDLLMRWARFRLSASMVTTISGCRLAERASERGGFPDDLVNDIDRESRPKFPSSRSPVRSMEPHDDDDEQIFQIGR